MRVVELEGIDNVRDFGGVAARDGRIVSSGLFYRGGALVGMTPSDRELFFGTLGVACVIDVRCGWEREAKPDVQVEGVENFHIPFYDLEKVGIEYTEPAAGTQMVGRDVACDPGRFYRELANPLTSAQMGKGLDCIFEHALAGIPVYEHCSGGKDRAGILAMLVLDVLGVARELIEEDYLYTNVSRDKNYEKMFARFLLLSGGDEQRAHELVVSHRARTENLQAFFSSVEERYGGWAAFRSDVLGYGEERCKSLRDALTSPSFTASALTESA